MALIRQLLGQTLQRAFDLDRESGPRWLAGQNVYLFSDPLQQGFALREQQVTHIRNKTDQNVVFVDPGEDHSAILRALYCNVENVSGSSANIEVRIILKIPEEGSSGFTDIQLYESDTISLAAGADQWFRLDDFPFLKDFRVPANATLRISAWGLSGSGQEWAIRALWDKIPRTVWLAK